MDSSKYPSDEEFLALLKLMREEISPELAPVTLDWVSALQLETEGFLAIGGSLTAKRLALSLIQVLGRFEYEYGHRQ
ncbi:hypothetical protein ACXIUA_10770 [Corynebacterium sp. UMB8791]